MYDRRLDAIVSAADLGSFSRAAERLCVSTPALVKQVSGRAPCGGRPRDHAPQRGRASPRA